MNQSLIHKHLLSSWGDGVEVYDQSYIQRNCQTTFLGVYYEFIVGYLLLPAIIFLHVYVVRKAILLYRPEWGLTRRERIEKKREEQKRLTSSDILD